MICEREMSSAGGGKQLKKVMMTESPMAENSRERMQLLAQRRLLHRQRSEVVSATTEFRLLTTG